MRAVPAALAALVLLATLGAPALAQDTAEPIGVSLTAIDGIVGATVGPDEPSPVFGVTLQLDSGRSARSDLRLVLTVSSRVADTGELDAALGGEETTPYASVSRPLPDLPARATVTVAADVTAAELDLDGEDLEGVYPLEVGVFDGGEQVGAARTALVVQPDLRRAPMRASLLVDVAGDPVPMAADGIATRSLVDLLAPDGDLVAAVRSLDDLRGRGRTAGVSLTVDGHLLEDLAQVADGVEVEDGRVLDVQSRLARRADAVRTGLRAMARRAGTEILVQPYARGDLVALTRAGQASAVEQAVALGRLSVDSMLGSTSGAAILVPPDGLDVPTIAALGATGTGTLLLDATHLAVPPGGGLHPVRRLRTDDGGEVDVLMPDRALSRLLEDPEAVGIPAMLQRLRAETALRWMQSGSRRADALLLHAVVPGPLADGALEGAAALLSETPWLRPVSPSALARQVQPAADPVRLAYPLRARQAELDAEYLGLLDEARQALLPLEAMLPPDDGTADRFARTLRSAAAVAFRDDQARPAGLARIEEVIATFATLSRGVTVIEAPPITLTSTTGEIPVALRNDTDLPLAVLVQLASSRFAIDEPSRSLLMPPRSVQTMTFRARALTPGGLAGVGVTVLDPTGTRRLSSTTLAVRSTAFPVVALGAVLVGAAVLLAYGVRQGRRRLRPRVPAAHDLNRVA